MPQPRKFRSSPLGNNNQSQVKRSLTPLEKWHLREKKRLALLEKKK